MASHCANNVPHFIFPQPCRRLQFSRGSTWGMHASHSLRSQRSCHTQASGDEPDWDAEMQMFRERTMRPNQLETLRKAEEQDVDIGKVLFIGEGLAIVDGLNNDAPVGTMLAFVSGATGVLMWRRSDNICFVLLLGGDDSVIVGEQVECKVKGILQVVDAQSGPATQRDYEQASVPAGDALLGQVVDWLGRRPGEQQQIGADAWAPLLAEQLDMDSREQIAEALTTGVRAIDILTPLGRGQAQLLTGPHGSGKTLAAVDAILGQAGAGVRCVYASVGQTAERQQAAIRALQDGGAMAYTIVVAAPEGAPLGRQYGSLCAALSVAERQRDAGGHTLVVLDDTSCMAAMWDRITQALAELGPAALALSEGQEDMDVEAASEEELVEYEGMLISASAAQRRRFFSSLVQRAAKVHRRRGGGSLTLLMVLPGQPVLGQRSRPRPPPSGYRHLTPGQRAKLEAALAQMSGAAADAAEGVRTEVVEEFMSIADGQTVLRAGDAGSVGVSVDPRLSVSRIGSRAFPPALEALAPQIRFELAQAADVDQFGAHTRAADNNQAALRRAAVVQAALQQPPRRPATLVDEVVELVGLTGGFLDSLAPDGVRPALERAREAVQHASPQTVADIAATEHLSEDQRAEIGHVFRQLMAQAAW